ncbi:NADH dehydrogenase, partial [Halomonas sp. SUBG004]
VVKAGAFGILRVIYDLYGIELSVELGVTTVLAVAASITIIYGSLRAIAQEELKPRLAFSTISQVSYVVLGVSLFGPFGTIGALAHLLHQGLMKVTLFFCAGNYAEELGDSSP